MPTNPYAGPDAIIVVGADLAEVPTAYEDEAVAEALFAVRGSAPPASTDLLTILLDQSRQEWCTPVECSTSQRSLR